MRKFLVLTFLFLVPSILQAQATGDSKLLFDQTAVTLVEANSYIYRYYPDAATTGVILTVICTGTVSPFTCSAAFPAFTPGTHTLTLTAANLAGESAKSAPFTFTFVVVPGIPANIRIG